MTRGSRAARRRRAATSGKPFRADCRKPRASPPICFASACGTTSVMFAPAPEARGAKPQQRPSRTRSSPNPAEPLQSPARWPTNAIFLTRGWGALTLRRRRTTDRSPSAPTTQEARIVSSSAPRRPTTPHTRFPRRVTSKTRNPNRTLAPARRASSRSALSKSRRRTAQPSWGGASPFRPRPNSARKALPSGASTYQPRSSCGRKRGSRRSATPRRRSSSRLPGLAQSPHGLSRGNRDRSNTSTSRPARARAIAVAAPAGPPPTITTSALLMRGASSGEPSGSPAVPALRPRDRRAPPGWRLRVANRPPSSKRGRRGERTRVASIPCARSRS